jgi:uncharacterized protein
MDIQYLLRTRREKDEFFKQHPQSPLTSEQRPAFNGLIYYDHNPELDLRVTVEPFAEQIAVPIQTTTGDVREYIRYGEFTFMIGGQAARLTIYETDFGFFLPFTDASAGGETYGAGRYLEPEYLGGNTFHVDFNQAYNPFCAYNPNYSCPITPPVNRLKVAIRAGEKAPTGEWVTKA